MTNDRVQRALDGDLPLDQLDPSEAELYHQYRQAFAVATQAIPRLPEVDVAPSVLRRITEGRSAGVVEARPTDWRSGPARICRWLWAPRTLTLRPAFGLAAAAVAALVWITQIATVGGPAATAPHAPKAQRMVVEFRLAAPEAYSVALVGDFNAWQPEHELRETAPGVWTVSVALEPGVYDYGFMVDGATLRLDPLAPRVADGFGGESSRVAVLPPEVRT